ncbi:hypothetical protein BKA69DRAFT_898367 [Paraphysoderma sedebokerense]|nr:hypothetical protein BKA69DRAFT_898367 [Paraphysoderma sedebokerense]
MSTTMAFRMIIGLKAGRTWMSKWPSIHIIDNFIECNSTFSNSVSFRNNINGNLTCSKYTLQYYQSSSPEINIYRYNSDVTNSLSSYKYSNTMYLNTAYAHPRLKMDFDSSNVYICHYNDATRSPNAGYFIAKLSHLLNPIQSVTNRTQGALSIKFFCRQSPMICVWTTTRSVTEYWMSNLTVYRTYSLNESPIPLGFNPKIVETPDGAFSYYLHHDTSRNNIIVLHKKNASHVSVPNEAVQLPYNTSLPPPEMYDMARSNDGDIFVGMMTSPQPSVGLGDRDIAVLRYSSTLQLKSQFLLSTILADNITRIFLPNGNIDTIVICGSTDGHPNSTLETNPVRRAFVARFGYFEITNVSTRFKNLVQPGERINVTFSSIPSAAISAVPIVQFNQNPCQGVQWIDSVLSAIIPFGTGGPFDISVEFNYLPHSPSVIAQNYTYVPKPQILNIEPREGPASGYNITLNTANVITDDSSLIIFIGMGLCADVRRVNASALSCHTPPGTGRNISVILSVTGLVNSTEIVNISYAPPKITHISPVTVSTAGSSIWIKGMNFGPCSSSPCIFSNIVIYIESFGSCNNGTHYNDTDLQCNAPEGFDTNNTVTISVDGQVGAPSVMSYGKPVISSINPSASISKNPTVIIEGYNFGSLNAPRVVIFRDTSTLLNYTCPNATWISHQTIRCQFTTVDLPSTATLDVTVMTGNQSNSFSGDTLFRTGITNNPPVTSPLNVTVNEDQSVILEFQCSDPDADDSVTIYITRNPINGILYQISNNGDRGALIDTVSGSIAVTHSILRVLYIPDQDFSGNDSFRFKARDSWNADSSIEVADILVIAVNDPPLAQNRTYQMFEDTEFAFMLRTIDTDSPTSEQTVIILSLPTNGILSAPNITNATVREQITAIPIAYPQSTTFKFSPFSNFYGTDSFEFIAYDGYLNSTANGTITFNIRPVNDPPFLNVSNLNLTVYEDAEALFTFDVVDSDIGDKLTVKITNLAINGTMTSMDIQKGAKVLLGEGSEIKGPPYQLFYLPFRDYYSRPGFNNEYFNISYTDGKSNESWYQVSFSVLPVNDPPYIPCLQPEIILPTNFTTGASRNHSISLSILDPEMHNLTLVLASEPLHGVLKTSDGQRLHTGSLFRDFQLIFDAERMGGGYPYSNFTVFAIDSENATSNNCTYFFTFICPLGLYNNIFSNGRGELCEPCPQGVFILRFYLLLRILTKF